MKKVIPAERSTERLATSWTDLSSLRWDGSDRPNSRMDKISIVKFLEDNNIPHAKIMKEFSCAADISLDCISTSGVLKPVSLWSTKGVRVLKRIKEGSFQDFMSGDIMSESHIVSEAIILEKKMEKKLGFQIEERIEDEDIEVDIPFDYKIFSFFGNTEFILQVDRNHTKPKLNFFDGYFQEILDHRVDIPGPNSQERRGIARTPTCAEDLVRLANNVTTILKAPFISVDCYATPRGAVFGELTHTPGGPWFGAMYRFSEDFDKFLGSKWNEARTRLGLEAAKVRSPFTIATTSGKNGRLVE